MREMLPLPQEDELHTLSLPVHLQLITMNIKNSFWVIIIVIMDNNIHNI